jgi:EAL domain-containing protein (putative c-di-GMP-specific phosphodiesterase class I)
VTFSSSPDRATATTSSEFDRVLSSGLLRTAFQPIIDLETISTIAYDTVALGPAGSILESTTALRAAAARAGRLPGFDGAARRDALAHAATAGLNAPRSLFLGIEPSTVHALADDTDALSHPMVLKISGRELESDLVPLLKSLTRIRDHGWAIAVTEVGIDPAALALLPAIAPDVITLDLRLLEGLPDQHVASVLSSVTAYSEATGCLVLADGIETEQQVVTARALGATLGQGPLFGRAAELPSTLPWLSGVRPAPTGRLAGLRQDTPFSVAAERREARPSNSELLLQISLFLEARAAAEGGSALVFTTFQNQANFDDRAVARYDPLGESAAFVGAFGQGFTESSINARVTAVDLDPADPLIFEWNVLVISPNFAATLTARKLDPSSPSTDRYEFILTHDRRLTIEAARTLVARL